MVDAAAEPDVNTFLAPCSIPSANVEKAINDLFNIPGFPCSGTLDFSPRGLLRPAKEAPKSCAYLPTCPTVLEDMPAAPSENVPIFRTRVWVVSEKVAGFGFGLIFLVNTSAPFVIALARNVDPVTIKREAVADDWTSDEF
jgi:hypothetical protein